MQFSLFLSSFSPKVFLLWTAQHLVAIRKSLLPCRYFLWDHLQDDDELYR